MAPFTMKLKVYQCKHASRCCEENGERERKREIKAPSKCVAQLPLRCEWVNENDVERATENKFREFVVIWVVFREWAATQPVSQLVARQPNQQTSLIKNENIINSTTLFFLVGIVVIVVATNSIITSLSFELRYRMHVVRRRHEANDKMIPAFFPHFYFFLPVFGMGRRNDDPPIWLYTTLAERGPEEEGKEIRFKLAFKRISSF